MEREHAALPAARSRPTGPRPVPTGRAARDELDALAWGRVDQLALLRAVGPHAAALPSWMLARALWRPAAGFVQQEGKRVRAELVTLGWRVGGGAGPCPPVLGETIELLHAGALIVDDIQDAALTRRGRPALHRRIGVPLALNVGNWLYFWPLERLARLDVPPETALALARRVVHAVCRCHVGQALDLRLRPDEVRRRDVPGAVHAISELKTGALTELAVTLGAVAAGAGPRRTAALARFGMRVGIGVQMLNDLADLGATPGTRARWTDLRAGRVTWPWAWLARTAPAPAWASLRARARAVRLDGAPPAPLGRALRARVGAHGRRVAASWLARAADAIRSEAGPHRAVEAALRRLRA